MLTFLIDFGTILYWFFIILESFGGHFGELLGSFWPPGSSWGALGRSWGHPVRVGSHFGAFWESFWSHFGSFLAPLWRQIQVICSREFLDRLLTDFGSILEHKSTNFGAKKCSEIERVTFQKHRFSLSKSYVFELGAPPEHQKNESESDAETKLDFRAFLDHFWSSKGLILRSILE